VAGDGGVITFLSFLGGLAVAVVVFAFALHLAFLEVFKNLWK
jgi:hypothetical protein